MKTSWSGLQMLKEMPAQFLDGELKANKSKAFLGIQYLNELFLAVQWVKKIDHIEYLLFGNFLLYAFFIVYNEMLKNTFQWQEMESVLKLLNTSLKF